MDHFHIPIRDPRDAKTTVHRPVRARRSRPFFQRIPKQSIP